LPQGKASKYTNSPKIYSQNIKKQKSNAHLNFVRILLSATVHAPTNDSKEEAKDQFYEQLERAVRRVATNTIGYTRKQAGKVWFHEECENVNEEKNAYRANAIHRVTRPAQDKYKQARSIETNLFKEKSRQLDEEALIEIE
jgi:hypothetical protein